MEKKYPKIAFGTRSWGVGAAGVDTRGLWEHPMV